MTPNPACRALRGTRCELILNSQGERLFDIGTGALLRIIFGFNSPAELLKLFANDASLKVQGNSSTQET